MEKKQPSEKNTRESTAIVITKECRKYEKLRYEQLYGIM